MYFLDVSYHISVKTARYGIWVDPHEAIFSQCKVMLYCKIGGHLDSYLPILTIFGQVYGKSQN